MSGATHAIPTTWNGIQFRSRLEARWASFFTKLGWEWSYEPIDLKGYIPDFLLHMHEDVLVEVKPFTRFEDPSIGEAKAKVLSSGWEGPFGVVGARFTGFWLGPHLIVDGLCRSCFHIKENGNLRMTKMKTFRLAEDRDRNVCLVCGNDDEGDMYNCRVGFEDHDVTIGRVALWNEAGNEVQWLGRGRRA